VLFEACRSLTGVINKQPVSYLGSDKKYMFSITAQKGFIEFKFLQL